MPRPESHWRRRITKIVDTGPAEAEIQPRSFTAGWPELSPVQPERTRVRRVCESRVNYAYWILPSSGSCARLRTIDRSNGDGETRTSGKTAEVDCAPRLARGQRTSTQRTGETRKARKDAIPHERGLSPVPPSEFSSLPSPIAIPASAAKCQLPDLRQRLPRLTSKQFIDPKGT